MSYWGVILCEVERLLVNSCYRNSSRIRSGSIGLFLLINQQILKCVSYFTTWIAFNFRGTSYQDTLWDRTPEVFENRFLFVIIADFQRCQSISHIMRTYFLSPFEKPCFWTAMKNLLFPLSLLWNCRLVKSLVRISCCKWYINTKYFKIFKI